MDTDKYILGIDTSNYKTSLALVGQEDIRLDLRKFLEVKPGERGLRQSEALFQHVRNLPELFEEVRSDLDMHGGAEISAVAFSSRPRPVEGSYMPCFIAGESFGRSLAAMLDVPAISFSHQEGHLEAIKAFTEMSYIDHFIACHFSGGTCEILYVRPSEAAMPYVDEYGGYIAVNGENTIYDITLVGGT